MNLPLTPLEEAWNTPKPKKMFSSNQYTNNQMQVKILKEADQVIHKTHPKANDNKCEHSAIIETTAESENPVNETKQGLSITITNPGLLKYLSKYNTKYINEFVQNALHEFLKTKQTTETFINKGISTISQNDNLQTILLIFVILYAIDLCMRFKRLS